MTGLSNTLGRGLLILALGSCAFACGDDDGGGKPKPDGGEAGSGGTGGGGAGDDGGAGTGSISVAECVTATKKITTDMTTDACLTCACTESTDKVTACDATCWGLIGCFAGPCKDVDPTDTTAATTCVTTMCADIPDLLTKGMTSAPAATALGGILSGACASDCGATPPPTDGGTDAGPDMDGGDTDGGN